MFGLSTKLITKGKLAAVKRSDSSVINSLDKPNLHNYLV